MIKFANVTKTYVMGDNQVEALKGVTFEIKKGELVAIMGPSGSGKSTAMNIIGLLDRPSGGEYLLNGKNTSQLSNDETAFLRNEMIGFVFQSFFLLPRLDALHNVMLPLSYQREIVSNQEALALASLARVGVDHLAHHKPQQMSGGQQQRVAIARALICKPSVILADEPTGALDTKTSQDVMNLLIELNEKEGNTIVIVTHDQEVGEQCRRIIKIVDGKVVSGD